MMKSFRGNLIERTNDDGTTTRLLVFQDGNDAQVIDGNDNFRQNQLLVTRIEDGGTDPQKQWIHRELLENSDSGYRLVGNPIGDEVSFGRVFTREGRDYVVAVRNTNFSRSSDIPDLVTLQDVSTGEFRAPITKADLKELYTDTGINMPARRVMEDLKVDDEIELNNPDGSKNLYRIIDVNNGSRDSDSGEYMLLPLDGGKVDSIGTGEFREKVLKFLGRPVNQSTYLG